ncbi:MAG: hypothetical protein CFE26_05795, partial [Verrucomicrobiales bacterium VVV1]
MKLHPEDPRLTAYLLGELSPDEAAAVERAADADATVRTALDETYKVQRVLMGALAPDSTALLPRQRENIRRAVRESANAGEIVPFPVRKTSPAPYLMPLGIAAAIALISWIAFKKPDTEAVPIANGPATPPASTGNDPVQKLPFAVAILPAPGPKVPGATASPPPQRNQLAINAKALDAALQNASGEMLEQMAQQLSDAPLPDTSTLPDLVSRGAVSTAVAHELELPVLAGRASLGWIYKSVKDQGRRPDARTVRLEEILNAFELRPNGTASIAKGTSVSAESLACPWKPSATLLMIHFQGAASGSRKVEAVLDVDPTAVASYRLLGFSPIRGLESGPMPAHLPEKTGTTLLVEIEPRASASNLGEIRWKVEGADAAPLPILRKPDAEPSDDARFAALLASYSLWLTK